MPQKRKTRNNRKKRGGRHPNPFARYDNKGRVIPGQYKNNRGIPPSTPSPLPGTPPAAHPASPPPSPPPLARRPGYDMSEQPDVFSSDESSISPASSDALAALLGTPTRLNLNQNLNQGRGLRRRKTRKTRKSRNNKKLRKTRKTRKSRNNKKMRKTRKTRKYRK